MEWMLGLISLMGMGISAYGQYREGMDAAEASRYNADISRQNAEREAQMVEQSGAFDALQQRKQNRILSGTQKAAYGASGVELSGSPLDVMIQTAGEGELDANIMEWNYRNKAQAIRYAGQSQAYQDEKAGDTYAASGMSRVGATLLTSASKYYSPLSSATATKPARIGSYSGYRTSGGKPYGGY